MNIFKKLTATALAAAVAASVSVCAFAEDISQWSNADFKYTTDNCASADGYENEAKAVLKSHGSDITVYDGVFAGILTDDTIITIDSSTVDKLGKVSAEAWLKRIGDDYWGDDPKTDQNYTRPEVDVYFVLYNFSEDNTKLEQKGVMSHDIHFSHPFWTLNGNTMSFGGYPQPEEYIDGCGIARCSLGDFMVIGNKISGNIIRQLVETGCDDADYDFDDCDMVEIYFPTGYDEFRSPTSGYILSFLTDSYVKAHPSTSTPETPATPAAAETHKVTADKELTVDEFTALLEENKTKDVEISAGDVTYTFKKGEMNAVDGAKYDFGASVTTDFSKLASPDKALNKDNFVMHVDFNYSGKLPAKASIKLNVGKAYAGKTLYYSQVMSEGCKFVQSAKVDADGFITVTQDHCSEYVLTTVNVDENAKKNPGTGVSGIPAVMAVLALGAVIVSKKRK